MVYDALADTKNPEKCWGCGENRVVMQGLGLCSDCQKIY